MTFSSSEAFSSFSRSSSRSSSSAESSSRAARASSFFFVSFVSSFLRFFFVSAFPARNARTSEASPRPRLRVFRFQPSRRCLLRDRRDRRRVSVPHERPSRTESRRASRARKHVSNVAPLTPPLPAEQRTARTSAADSWRPRGCRPGSSPRNAKRGPRAGRTARAPRARGARGRKHPPRVHPTPRCAPRKHQLPAPRVPAENTAGVPGEPGALVLRASVSPGRGAFHRSVVDDAARFAVRSARPRRTETARRLSVPARTATARGSEAHGGVPCEPAPGGPI